VNSPAREEEWAIWLRAAISGDVGAYRRFLEDVTPRLRAMARRRCERYGALANDVEDIVQEVLLAIHLKRGTWDQSRPIGPWISTIVRNKLVDTLRRRGRHVSVPIEDIVDTGFTLRYLLQTLASRGPNSLAVCTFLDRNSRRIVQVPVEYRCFEIPDHFVIGFGLDYNQLYRNLNYVAVLKPEHE